MGQEVNEHIGGKVMKLGIILGLIVILIVSAPGALSARQAQTSSDGVSDEEYEIYASVIKQLYIQTATKQVIVEERTFRYDFAIDNDEPWRDKPKKGLTIDQAAADDYEAKNGQKWLLNKTSFKLPVKVSLITDLDLKAIFHGHWGELEWIDFYRKYPDSRGFVMVSRIGFNTAHTQALLYVGSRCGPGCGDLHFLLLEKSGGFWSTKKELRKKDFG